MKIRKIILLVVVVVFVSAMAVNTSSAASSEKLTKYNTKIVDTINKKIVTVNLVTNWNDSWERNGYYKFKIKDKYKSKFKINSIKIKYYSAENEKYVYRTYNTKNKDVVYLKIPKNSFVEKITLFYKTKPKIMIESLSYKGYSSTSIATTVFNSKKVKITVKEKGYTDWSEMGGWPTTTYQNFQIKSKNTKYKIKSVKILYYSRGGLEKVKTIKGYGKTILNFKFYEKLEDISAKVFIINYY
ncbi:MAG: hypothetical protein ACRCVG_04065 [Methanobacteriaceae archaeon]